MSSLSFGSGFGLFFLSFLLVPDIVWVLDWVSLFFSGYYALLRKNTTATNSGLGWENIPKKTRDHPTEVGGAFHSSSDHGSISLLCAMQCGSYKLVC